MKYFYDTEFHDNGKRIDLISIAIVCEDGREYQAVNVDCDFERVCKHDWLWENVIPHLPTSKLDWDDPNFGRAVTWLDTKSAIVKPKWVIANEVREFLLHDLEPDMGDLPIELWAYYGAYDHVALAQLWGPMIKLPTGIPMWTHDLMHLVEENPLTPLPVQTDQHDALADARWNALVYRQLTENPL